MRCLTNEWVQRFIDDEVTAKKKIEINHHLDHCNLCNEHVIKRKILSENIKKSVHQLIQENHSIPAFSYHPKAKKIPVFSKIRLISGISAACILGMVLLITNRKNPEKVEQVTIIHTIGSDVDANRPVTEQQMTINVIDPNGNVSEYSIK